MHPDSRCRRELGGRRTPPGADEVATSAAPTRLGRAVHHLPRREGPVSRAQHPHPRLALARGAPGGRCPQGRAGTEGMRPAAGRTGRGGNEAGIPVPEERAAAQKPAHLVLEAPELTVQIAVQGRVPEPQVRRRFHRAARPLARPRGRFPANLLQLLAFGAEKRTPSHPHAATQSPPSSTARPLPPPRWPCPDRLPGHQVKKEQARESGLLQRSPLEQTLLLGPGALVSAAHAHGSVVPPVAGPQEVLEP